MRVLGLNVARPYTTRRAVIGGVETSSTGNVILRLGDEQVDGDDATTGWSQTGQITLDLFEAQELIMELQGALAAAVPDYVRAGR